MGIMKWYMQMPTAVGVSEGLTQSQLEITGSTLLGATADRGLQLSNPPPGREADMLWGLEDNTACYGQEK